VAHAHRNATAKALASTPRASGFAERADEGYELSVALRPNV
jgi:hypothetical protein